MSERIIEKKKFSLPKGFKLAGIIAASACAILIISAMTLDWFFDHYDLHFESPIVLQNPVSLSQRRAIDIAPVQAAEPKKAQQ